MARDRQRRPLTQAGADQLKKATDRVKQKQKQQNKQPDSDTKGNPEKSPSKRDSTPRKDKAVKPAATETNLLCEGKIEASKPKAVETAPKTPPSINRSIIDSPPPSRGSPSHKSRREKRKDAKKESASVKTEVSSASQVAKKAYSSAHPSDMTEIDNVFSTNQKFDEAIQLMF